MANIHPTAIVDPGAGVDSSAEIGPYCIVGPRVRIEQDVRLMSHVVIDGATTLGAGCTIFPFASVGAKTQDLKFEGGEPRVEIGEQTTLREYVTVNAATADGDVTRVGAHCLIMAYSHVAHDCLLGDHVIIANAGTLAGHVVMEDYSILGGLSGIHQFVRIGRSSIIGGCSKVTQDVPPFMMADGNPLEVRGLNRIGLDRREVPAERQKHLKQAYRLIYRRDLSARDAVSIIRDDLPEGPEINHLAKFVETSERGITR